MLEKITFTSQQPGQKLLVLGAVHGNEPAGTLACRQLSDDLTSGKLKLLCGSLTLMPLCNPRAAAANCRQIDENLNRIICRWENPNTYEKMLANELAPEIAAADFTLDLHSTHCQGDLPFVFLDYLDSRAETVIKNLPVEFVLTGWPEIYAADPTIADFSTLYWAHHHGKSALTVECGWHFSPAAANLAYQIIVSTLQSLGMLAGEPIKNPSQQVIKMTSYQRKEKAGELACPFRHLDSISQGQTLAVYEDGTEITATDKGVIIMPNPAAEIGSEWFYLGLK